MAINVTTVASEVVSQLNLATTYTAIPTDPRAYTSQISDAVLNSDGAVVEAICANPSNGQRAAFVTGTASVAHLGILPSRLGPIDSITVSGKAAMPWDVQEIEYERTNALNLTYPPRYAIVGNQLALNQGTASIRFAQYTRGTVCQAPDEYYYPVLCGALAEVASIEGENDGLASFYAGQFQAMLQAIRAGQPPPPFVTA